MIEALPEISLGTAAILIFLVCALYVVIRGMLRMMIGTLVLAASVWLGFQTWQMAPELSLEWLGSLSPIVLYGLPTVVFLVSFFVLRMILKFVTRPFAERADEFREDRFSMRRLAFRVPLLLIPTALLFVIGAVIVHHIGSLEEIRVAAMQMPGEEETAEEPSYLGGLKASVARTIPATWLAWLDPLTEPDRINLAKLIAIQESAPRRVSELEPVIDPTTGRPYPRAIVVEDAELQGLARDGSFGTLLRHPGLKQALDDPEVRRWIEVLRQPDRP